MATISTSPALKQCHKQGSRGLTKSWSFKESLRAFRRSFVNLSGGTESLYNLNDQKSVYPGFQRSPFLKRHSRHHNKQQHHYSSTCLSPTSQKPFDYNGVKMKKLSVWRALSPGELPKDAMFTLLPTQKLSRDVFASVTGPNSGLLAVQNWARAKSPSSSIFSAWKTTKNRKAHGLSLSLYEKNPLTEKITGDPVADAFVVRARGDSAFLAAADGVNWGREAMQAARCAIHAVYEHLESQLYGEHPVALFTTQDAAQLLFETLSVAQERISAFTTGLTTLCVALVLPIEEKKIWSSASASTPLSAELTSSQDDLKQQGHCPRCGSPAQPRQFAVVVVSVGDTQAFLLSKFHGIREITGWVAPTANGGVTPSVADIPPERDFRDAGGALGAVYKDGSPSLNNLICAVTICQPGDIVILGSDGLTDNFDPIITGLAKPKSPHLAYVDEVSSDTGEENEPAVSQRDSPVNPPPSTHGPTTFPYGGRLSPPPHVSIWPKPPPAPPDSPLSGAGRSRDCALPKVTDEISARSLNFTNQLELSWPERRCYAGKEMERVWHELDASQFGTSPSSRDLCEALIRHALEVTAAKRSLLQQPEVARLRNGTPLKKKQQGCGADGVDSGDSEETVRLKRRWLTDTLKQMTGKMDHATVTAYEVGYYRGDENEVYEESHLADWRCRCDRNSVHSGHNLIARSEP